MTVDLSKCRSNGIVVSIDALCQDERVSRVEDGHSRATRFIEAAAAAPVTSSLGLYSGEATDSRTTSDEEQHCTVHGVLSSKPFHQLLVHNTHFLPDRPSRQSASQDYRLQRARYPVPVQTICACA